MDKLIIGFYYTGRDYTTIIIIIFLFLINEIKNLFWQNLQGIINKLKAHFSSFWKGIDILLILAGLVSTSLDLAYIFDSSFFKKEDSLVAVKVLYSIFLLFNWIRLLDFARGFTVTSALVRLLTRVISDMLGFLLVLFLTIIGIALSSNKKLYRK